MLSTCAPRGGHKRTNWASGRSSSTLYLYIYSTSHLKSLLLWGRTVWGRFSGVVLGASGRLPLLAACVLPVAVVYTTYVHDIHNTVSNCGAPSEMDPAARAPYSCTGSIGTPHSRIMAHFIQPSSRQVFQEPGRRTTREQDHDV